MNQTQKTAMLRQGRKMQSSERIRLERRNLVRSMQLLWVNRLMVLFVVLVVAIAMAFPASLLILARNLQHLAGNWERELQVQLYLDKEIQTNQKTQLLAFIGGHDSVQSYRSVDAEEGLAEFATKSGLSNVIDVLGYNPLPDVVLITPVGQHPVLLEKLLVDMSLVPGVADVAFDQKWALTLANFFDLMNLFTSVVLQLLLVGLFVLIAGNVSALVSRSAHEIRVIKLIGATDAFVSRPYIYFGAMVGLLGGIGAFSLVVFVLTRAATIVDRLLTGYGIGYQLQTPTWWELLFLLFGPMLLGILASMLSCRSAINKAMPDFR